MASDIVRIDFIGSNPNRSQANAIFMALVEGPIVGVVIVFLGGSLCVAASAMTAKATNFLFGKVPLWMLPINTLVCGAAIYAQIRWGFFQPLNDGPLIPAAFYPLRIAGGYFYLFITLLTAWWLTRPARPEDVK